ncbi:MAG: hypothetical protein Q7N50_02545, partial [Armatimonadota bacterium]|nr:hypothetical protein [Armatimonadota bacterium]
EAQDAATFHNIPEGGTGVFTNKHGHQVGQPIQGAPKSRMVPLADPDSPTGFSYGDANSGQITEGAYAPAPHDYNADALYRSATLDERIRHNQATEGKPTSPHQAEIETSRKVTALQKDLNTRLNSAYKKYGFTGDDITKIMDGDTGIIRNKLNPQQATALDAEIGNGLRDYDNTRENIDGTRPMGTTRSTGAPQAGGDYQQFKDAYETIRNAPNLSNGEKNKRINELNGRARKMGIIK